MSVNKVILVGHMGKDPDIRFTASNMAMASFSLATGRVWKNRQGERQEETEWHRIVAFGKIAEVCRDYLRKGRQVYIEGRLQTREWEDKSGARRRTIEVVAETMQMLGRKGGNGDQSEDAMDEHAPMEEIPF